MCFADQWREKLDHQVKLAEIVIDQVFQLVEAVDRRLTGNDETAIIEAVVPPCNQAMQSYSQEQEKGLRDRGLASSTFTGSMNSMWNMTCAEATQRITATVRTRTRDWDRKRREARRLRRKEWLDRIPAWWSIILAIGGVAIGWVARDFVPDVVPQEKKNMGELKWFDYSGQSTEEMLTLEGKYRTDSLVVAFDQAVGQKATRVGEENLTQEERIILIIEALESEVNNGGYEQFFGNTSGEYAPVLVDALNRIGLPGTAVISQQAIDALGIRGPLTVDAIDRAMQEESEERTKKLQACDKRYFAEAGDLSGPLLEFIKANRASIRLRD